MTMINPDHTVLSKAGGNKKNERSAKPGPGRRPRGVTINAIVVLKKQGGKKPTESKPEEDK